MQAVVLRMFFLPPMALGVLEIQELPQQEQFLF